MKTYIKFRFIVSAIFFIPTMIWSQDPRTEFKNQMNTLFEYMDKSKITSGLLSDYAFEPVEIAAFNGVLSDSNYVDMETWISLYCSIYDAKINDRIII